MGCAVLAGRPMILPYAPLTDLPRLVTEGERVRQVMEDGGWRTLAEIAALIHARFGQRCAETGISARLRDLRKMGRTVESRRRGGAGGLYEYRVVPLATEGRLFS